MSDLKIIDFAKKGNVIRFFLGKRDPKLGWTSFEATQHFLTTPSDEYYGDDWDDVSYEDNAGLVYNKFVKRAVDVYIPYDYLVLEPADSETSSGICKEDLVHGRYACILIIPKELTHDNGSVDYKYWATRADNEIIRVFYEDSPGKLCELFADEWYTYEELFD